MPAVRGAAVAVLLLGALSVSCGGPAKSDDRPGGGPTTTAAADAAANPGTDAAANPGADADADADAEPVSRVRDAFAGLQATLDDSCTPGDCAYFLGRVDDELHRLDRAMKADPKGPGHFPEPIALIAELDKKLGGDSSFENLKKHQTLLLGTRDDINTWMQGHPDDYR
ncbi:hypothetical protein ASE09_08000 [Streptomyces sp. Root66D1]|nr:hypothetical protein ASD33_07995 [Streptomyces sp. Root1304]KRA90621.1 hypothetical protein ASE09_08000 [Streptomyces sp. Root66D1]